MKRKLLLLTVLAAACSTPPSDDESATDVDPLAFPFEGDEDGKSDVFGRSLVGVANPYEADLTLSDREEELRTNMRLRREVAWETARKALEPVPLLGLQQQIDRRPDCSAEVEPDDLGKCGRARNADACNEIQSGGVDICAWDEAAESCDATCDVLTLPDGQQIPQVPRFSTWYGVEDISKIFRHAYGGLTEDERVARSPLSDLLIGDAFMENLTAVERSNRWPLQRYTDSILELFECGLEPLPDEDPADFAARCAEARQSNFSGASAAGGGIARLVYSPAMVLHMMRNYGEVLGCRDDKLTDTWCGEGEPCVDPPENFSRCFKAEFPVDGGNPWEELAADDNRLDGLIETGGTVVIKATWARVGFGFDLPVYDTDADALLDQMGPGKLALWPEEGDRQIDAPEDLDDIGFPTADDIYTIKTKSGSYYRLTALHIMTKELRHWQWVTLWWSDEPDSDFGADRPESFNGLPDYWKNYKMCVVVDYLEGDEDAAARFDDYPSLQAALAATDAGPGQPSWCSNPYIERGAGNARTNCIGCHQHAGTRFDEINSSQPFELDAVIGDEDGELTATKRFPANGRTRRRTHFATDYSWAFSRLDDLTELVRSEVEFAGARDPRWQRINQILATEGDVVAGEEVFRNTTNDQACTDCHGENGEGGLGPDYQQVFAQKTDWQLMHTIIDGRGSMPAWGETLSDEQLADLFSYLRENFDTP